jgi:hypothetical protein
MKKIYFLLFVLIAPFLFSNFGLVEYAVLHPKSIQTDSLKAKQKHVVLYANAEPRIETKPDEKGNRETTSTRWTQYIAMGFKAILGFLLHILARF